jgi:hypothetical protein
LASKGRDIFLVGARELKKFKVVKWAGEGGHSREEGKAFLLKRCCCGRGGGLAIEEFGT